MVNYILQNKKINENSQDFNYKIWGEILSTAHVLPSSWINQYFITDIYKEWDIDNSAGVECGWFCSTCQSNFVIRGVVSSTREWKRKDDTGEWRKPNSISHNGISHKCVPFDNRRGKQTNPVLRKFNTSS